MNVPEAYDYLVRARRDLWATLESVPDEVLSRPSLDGARMHCIKGLVFHVAAVEDFWIHEDLLRQARAYLAGLTDDELKRIVIVHDAPEERYTVDGLLWHVMIHEMRHTAQIAVLLRTQGIEPPWLDLRNYLAFA